MLSAILTGKLKIGAKILCSDLPIVKNFSLNLLGGLPNNSQLCACINLVDHFLCGINETCMLIFSSLDTGLGINIWVSKLRKNLV